ncbi:MAG: signal peptidase I [Chloroflexota bacterium]
MARFDGPDDLPGVGEAEPGRSEAYDPLFGDWNGSALPEQPAADGDMLFGYSPVYADDVEHHDFYRYDPARASTAVSTAGYADAWGPQYDEQMTEWQRRLREGTVTIPVPERKWIVTIRELAETLLLAALIFLAVRASFQNFKVEGASMNPSLENGEYLIVNKLSYAEIDLSLFNFLPFFDAGDEPVHHLWGGPDRGDVVVFRAPTSPNRDFIKRVIGLPGDDVLIDDQAGTVTVNGKLLTEPYIQGTTRCGQQCDWKVPLPNTADAHSTCGADRCYFVMGDNRQNSSDSRQGWMVPEENIVGKTLVTYWESGGPNIGLAPNHGISYADDGSGDSGQ